MSSVKCRVVGRTSGEFENLSKCTQVFWMTARNECMASSHCPSCLRCEMGSCSLTALPRTGCEKER